MRKMMPTAILLVLILTLYPKICPAQSIGPPVLTNWELGARVKSLEEKIFFPRTAVISGDTSKLDIESDFRYVGKQLLQFDRRGKLAEQASCQPSYLSWRITYDTLGEMREGAYFQPDGQIRRFLSVLVDGRGYPERLVWLKNDSTVYDQKTLTFNEGGQKIGEAFKRGRTTTRFAYAYDEADRLYERATFNDDTLSSRRVISFNDDGTVQTVVAIRPGGDPIWEETYEYRQGILWTKKTQHYGRQSTTIAHYNAKGFPERIESSGKGGDETTVRYQRCRYRYDERGNWVRRITLENNELTEIRVRNLEYWSK